MPEKPTYIMIVDDMKMVRTSIKNYLTSLGYTNFIEAENGSVALNKLNQCREENKRIGLIFLDIVMPFIDGKEALKKIREIESSLPVVMLTSIADQKTINECTALGANEYLLKPINAETGPTIMAYIMNKLGWKAS
jgi:CheY-like chemotaxis protein